MYKIRMHRSVASVRSVWRRLERNTSPQTSVYQSYWVNAVVKKRLPVYGIPQKYSALYLELQENGETILILPLCKYWSAEKYCSIGKFNGFQVYDLIYSREMTLDKMKQCIAFVLAYLKPSELKLYNVPSSSLLFRAVNEAGGFQTPYSIECTENGNVCIDASEGYDAWYGALTKSTRQNIRTAYNRMKTDEATMDFVFYRGQRLPGKLLNGLIDLYCSRHASRYDVQTSGAKKLYLRYLDFSTACLRSFEDNFCAVLYINGKIAAFLSGMVEKNGTSVVVPRLSIDNQFSRYSPGVLLINETIKGFAGQSSLCRLDLSKGVEGYKLSMGGQMYYTYDITFTPEY